MTTLNTGTSLVSSLTGAFVSSRLGMKTTIRWRSPGRRILVHCNMYGYRDFLDPLIAFYRGEGHGVDTVGSAASRVSDYMLIFICDSVESHTEWPFWDELVAGGWWGRVVLLGEWCYFDIALGYYVGFHTLNERIYQASYGPQMYVNSDLNMYQAGANPDYYPEGWICTGEYLNDGPDLMVGVDQLLQSTCAPVMGGTWLAKSPRLASQTGEPYAGSYLPWLAMNQRGNTEWIVSGDTNHVNAGPHPLAGPPPYIPVFREGGGNWQFLKNLVEVPVPVG